MLSSRASETLKNARDAALKDRNYDSEGTRQMMSRKLQDVFNGRIPYEWQLDAAEALILGLDCVVVTGTGAGGPPPLTALPVCSCIAQRFFRVGPRFAREVMSV